MMTSVTKSGAAQAKVRAPGSSQDAPSARAWYALVIIVIALVFGAVDRQIFILVVEPMKHDLSLGDLQIGEISGFGPALFTALATFPLAWLADRIERRTVLCGCVIFWSIATAACGLATNFSTMFASTVAIAVGEASLTPIVYSLIPDLFPEKSRPRANIICYAAAALGGGLGLALGGGLISLAGDLRALLPASLQTLATWRLAFFIVAVPGPLIAIAVFLIGATRRIVTTAEAPAPAMRIRAYLNDHGGVALGVYVAMGCFGVALAAVTGWLPIAFIRVFHVTAASAGVGYGSVTTVGAVAGMTAAAILTPYWRRVAGAAFVVRAMVVASAGAAVPTVLLIFATNIWQAYGLVFFFIAIFMSGTSLIAGLLQDMAPAALRARVAAVGTVVLWIGASIGSVTVGAVSDKLTGNPRGLIWAIAAVAVAGFLLCAVLIRLMEGPYRRTAAAVAAA